MVIMDRTPHAKSKGGRPRTFDRDTALEAAMLLFWERGFEGVSIDDLTAAMGGIAPPSLYAAFGSKADLYRESLARYSGQEEPRWSIPTEGSAIEGVRQVFDLGVRVVTRNQRPRGCMVASGFVEFAPENADLALETRRMREANEVKLRALIERGVASGELQPDKDPARLARFFATVLSGLSVQARDGATLEELRAVAAEAISVLPATVSREK